jgi:hypothetical protein
VIVVAIDADDVFDFAAICVVRIFDLQAAVVDDANIAGRQAVADSRGISTHLGERSAGSRAPPMPCNADRH